MKLKEFKSENARYFPIVKHWAKLRPIYYSTEAHKVWWPNMCELHMQKAQEHGFTPRFNNRETPSDFDGCDWRCDRRGRPPEYWRFVCHGACHWLVDLNLFVVAKIISSNSLANRVLPKALNALGR